MTSLSLSLLTFHFYALEKEMATHSSVLAWKIPGTGDPAREREARFEHELISPNTCQHLNH